MPLSSVRAVAFDLDGTLYCGNTPVSGAVELLHQLQKQGLQIFYCTNNSTRTRQDICVKLNSMQISATEDKIYSAAYVSARYLKQQHSGDVYCFGTAGLHQELLAHNVDTVSNAEEAAVVLIGLDLRITYERILSLLPLRNKTCTLVACNRDKFFPADNGVLQLGCGFIVALVEEVLDRNVDYIVGKPNTFMLDLLAEEHGLAMDELVMIGDSLESDIAMARTAGCRSVLLSSQQDAPGVVRVTSLQELGVLFS